MTHITIEKDKIEQVIQWAEKHGEIVFAGGGMEAVDSMNVFVESLRRSVAKAEKQEPAAFDIRCDNCGGNGYDPKDNNYFCSTCEGEGFLEKLFYTHSQPKREPLTDEQVDDLHGEANRGFCIEREDYFKAFRDAEVAHCIKENT